MVEHHNGIVGVRGSNPLGSTDFASRYSRGLGRVLANSSVFWASFRCSWMLGPNLTWSGSSLRDEQPDCKIAPISAMKSRTDLMPQIMRYASRTSTTNPTFHLLLLIASFSNPRAQLTRSPRYQSGPESWAHREGRAARHHRIHPGAPCLRRRRGPGRRGFEKSRPRIWKSPLLTKFTHSVAVR